ncbi:MAG: beta-N-acetylhexosaminidase [Sphingomonadaceae bacterium]|nr:beta-N-acetylhexosaminidase [Sphingomonadaceae bacterium]
MLAAIIGLFGPVLTEDERAFIRDADPAGIVLFGRNVETRAQLRALTDSLREASGRADLPILVDQEGGRVARLGPPEWPAFPPAWRFSALYDKAPISAIEAARANSEALGLLLAEVGINVDCAPVLDLRHAGAHDVIGDRAFGAEPLRVAALGRAMLDGLAAAGVCGVIKHAPGHGRARADSHHELPVVDASEEELAADLAPFQALHNAPMAMTAHLLYRAWDAERPATLSPTIIAEIIRGRIDFEGLLMSDDLGMQALAGSLAERARGAIVAGCDVVLHCSGVLAESVQAAEAAGAISATAADRLARTMECASASSTQSYEALAAKRDALLAYAG